ncbi:MAG: hypothetical protein M3P18_11825 [Actinomycetota bacterium]|nr:hypothetical protein [Actinomycetota bacterium]
MRGISFLSGFLVGLMTLLVSPVALAHNADNFYGEWWHDSEKPVRWHFDNDFPTAGDKRQRVKDAFSTWEDAPGQLGFDRGDDIQGFPGACPGDGRSFVAFPSMGGDTLAQTVVCHFAGEVNRTKSFYILIDASKDWYDGASTPPPDSKYDIQAVATDEVGHSTSWGFPLGDVQPHLGVNANGQIRQPEYQNLCVDTPIHTMCPFTHIGTAYQRSLEEHDLDTFAHRY